MSSLCNQYMEKYAEALSWEIQEPGVSCLFDKKTQIQNQKKPWPQSPQAYHS